MTDGKGDNFGSKFKVFLISVFQHGSSNPVRDSSLKIVYLYLRKNLPNQDFYSGPFDLDFAVP